MRQKFLLLAGVLFLGSISVAQDGANDLTFNTEDAGFALGDGCNSFATVVAVLPDNRSIVGGSFQTYNGSVVYGLVRTTSDGLLDNTFATSAAVSNIVHAIKPQADGKLLVGGILRFAESQYGNLMRLLPNGSVDPSFISSPGADGSVTCIALQADGKILVGGHFSTYHGVSRNRIARLNADGTLDPTFNVGVGMSGSPGGGSVTSVDQVLVQANGRVLVSGVFTNYNGTSAGSIVRLTSSGAVDPAFVVGSGANGGVYTMALEANGGILIEGGFSEFNNTTANGLIRLNSFGSIDATFQPVAGQLQTLQLQPDGKILIGGDFSWAGGVLRNRVARLNSDGTLDLGFDPGAGAETYVRDLALRPDGKIVVVGDFEAFDGRGVGRMVLLSAAGAVDDGHNPVNGANSNVSEITQQEDGKILIAGSFTGFNGEIRKYIARLDANGSLDPTFYTGTGANFSVTTILEQPDGKILVAGNFTSYNGTTVKRIVRLSADGALDPTFNISSGVDQSISNCVLQPDGKILICGSFTSFNGVSRNRIARLNSDGSLDVTFDPATGANAWVNDLLLLNNGRVLICGTFTSFNGASRKNIARLNADGSLDATFDPGPGAGPGSAYVQKMALLADGRIMITGTFTTYSGIGRSRIARLFADGILDESFDPGTGLNGSIGSLFITPEGKVIVGGYFTNYNGVTISHLVRISEDGSLDASFTTGTGPSAGVNAISLTSDGKLLIGGTFTSYDGTGRNRIARLLGPATLPMLQPSVMLEGPFDLGSMNDALRTLPSFPLSEPFTALGYSNAAFTSGASIAPSVLSTTGSNAIVDWVIIEMRPAATPSTVAASHAALLQRDGDVVDLDGVSTVGFAGLAAGSYCVAIRSRNHLPVMLSPATPVVYGSGIATVDFTLPSTQVYDDEARINDGGVMVLAAGDVNIDGTVQYTGASNDRDAILYRIGGVVPTATTAGYWPEDVNMDGVVSYTGAGNDRDRVLVSIGGSVPTNTRVATLP
jgi:uncharacterized delta-60 repeat protein